MHFILLSSRNLSMNLSYSFHPTLHLCTCIAIHCELFVLSALNSQFCMTLANCDFDENNACIAGISTQYLRWMSTFELSPAKKLGSSPISCTTEITDSPPRSHAKKDRQESVNHYGIKWPQSMIPYRYSCDLSLRWYKSIQKRIVVFRTKKEEKHRCVEAV